MDDLNLSTHTVQFTNIIYNINSIVNKLKKSTDIEEIKGIIKLQHNIIFNYDNLINNNREGIQDLFTSTIFLDAFDSVAGIIESELTESEIIFINKIIYDYFEYSANDNSNVKDKLLCISYTINDKRVKALTPYVGVKLARLISIISYSSYKMEKIVHRINNFILNNDFDIKTIESIYYVIYGSRMTKFAVNEKCVSLFCYSMTEYCDSSDPEIINKFNEISNYLLNELIYCSVAFNENAYRMITMYANMITLMNIDKSRLRFSIKEELNKIKDEEKTRALWDIINYVELNFNVNIY